MSEMLQVFLVLGVSVGVLYGVFCRVRSWLYRPPSKANGQFVVCLPPSFSQEEISAVLLRMAEILRENGYRWPIFAALSESVCCTDALETICARHDICLTTYRTKDFSQTG
ncbi:MAG: hypothetical protein IKD06_05480 [Clostridia bacterium]|nr:hypothetical protein [Clostridia bacterium]